MDELRNRRDLMVAAYTSNQTWDMEENREQRKQALEGLHTEFMEAVAALYEDREPEHEDEWGDDPLFRPLVRQGIQEADVVMPQEGRGQQFMSDQDDPLLRRRPVGS